MAFEEMRYMFFIDGEIAQVTKMPSAYKHIFLDLSRVQKKFCLSQS